jgi:hypothetical protein
MITYLEDSNTYQWYNSTSWVGLVAQSPNSVINGAFDIWQRGTTFTSPSNGSYTADRWSAVFCSSVSRNTDVPLGFRFSAEFSGTSNTPNLNYRMESADSFKFANTTVTVSFWAKSITGTTSLSLQIFTADAVDNFSSVTLRENITLAATPSTSWTRYFATFTAPAASTNGLQIRIIRATGTTTTRITGVQLESGPVTTLFQRNANSLQGELAACQRYFQATGAGAVGRALSSTIAGLGVTFSVHMRAAPTLLPVTGNFSIVELNVAARTATAASLDGSGTSGAFIAVTTSGLTSPNMVGVYSGNPFLFSAEL